MDRGHQLSPPISVKDLVCPPDRRTIIALLHSTAVPSWTKNSKEVIQASDQLLLLLLFGSGRNGQTATHQSAFLLHGCCASLLQRRTTEGKYTCLRNAFNKYFYTHVIFKYRSYSRPVAASLMTRRRRQRCYEWNKEKRVQFEAWMNFQCCAKREQTFLR